MKGFLVIALVLFALGVCLAQPLPQAADSVKAYKPCPKCKVANFPDARFCFSCGTPFEAGAVSAALPESAWADSTRCPGCRAERLPQAEFCSNCGISFNTLQLAIKPPQPTETGPKKEPGLAFVCSLIIPGTGQLYNGEHGKAVLQMGLYGSGVYLLSTSDDLEQDFMKMVFGLGVCVVAMGWSAIDAPISSGRINHRRGYSALTFPGVGLMFVPDSRNPRRLQPGVGLRAGF